MFSAFLERTTLKLFFFFFLPPPGWLMSSTLCGEKNPGQFCGTPRSSFIPNPHSSRAVTLTANPWVLEGCCFIIGLISVTKIGLQRIMQLLSSQVAENCCFHVYAKHKMIISIIFFFQILRFKIEKLPVPVLTRTISFIPFVSSALYVCLYNLANILAPNPWSHAG